eukprot:COSAG04_NODE_28548_length_275_cov_0.579545_1_plen_37_part_10
MCTVRTETRYFPRFESFVFSATFPEAGVPRVNASGLL